LRCLSDGAALVRLPCRRPRPCPAPCPLLSSFMLASCQASTKDPLSHKEGDMVDIIANKVGPFANPTETYM
jgi:hypothetical protein